MNCQEFQNLVSDLAREQMMEVTARTQALAHGAQCDDCALVLENEQRLTAGLRSLAGHMESLEAGPVVEARVLAAFRDRVVVAPVAIQSRRWYWVGAAAAAVLLVFGVVAIRGRVIPIVPAEKQQVSKDTPQVIPANNDQAVPSPAPQRVPQEIVGYTPYRNVVSPRRPTSRSRPSQPAPTFVSDSTNSEIATDFFPVGDARAMNLQDGGQLMRVELPRSTMARFGLPVNSARANEKVKADVLVSSDGLARAIRFVQ